MIRSVTLSTVGTVAPAIVGLTTFNSSYEGGLLFGIMIIVLSNAPLTLFLRDEHKDLIDGGEGFYKEDFPFMRVYELLSPIRKNRVLVSCEEFDPFIGAFATGAGGAVNAQFLPYGF